MIPTFDRCLVCDAVRQEQNRKLLIIGFLGICPHVNVGVQRLDQPAVLTFLISGGPGDGPFTWVVQIFDETTQAQIVSTPPKDFAANPTNDTTLAASLPVLFGHPGPFSVRLLIDDVERFRAPFQASQGVVD